MWSMAFSRDITLCPRRFSTSLRADLATSAPSLATPAFSDKPSGFRCLLSSVAVSSATRVRTAVGEINPSNLPCFVVGYLGASDSKTPYSRFTTRFYDCYKQASVVSAEYGTVNNFDLEANHGADRFDFVFASKNVSVKAYGQLQSAYYTQESGVYKRRLLSTHFPVMAKVSLTK